MATFSWFSWFNNSARITNELEQFVTFETCRSDVATLRCAENIFVAYRPV